MGNSALATATQIGFTLAGFAIAGPFGAAIGAGLGAFVAQELFGEDIEVSRGRIADLKVSVSQYGDALPAVWGCSRFGGSAYFNTDLIEKVHKESESGKGGQTVTSKTFYYSITIGYKFTENHQSFPVVAIPQLWANGKMIADYTATTTPPVAAKYVGEGGGPFNSGIIRFRLGGEDQLPDPAYEEIAGVGTTPSDRGYSTVVLEDFPLEDFGNVAPQLNALVCTAVSDNFPAVQMTWTQNTKSLRFIPGTRLIYVEGDGREPILVNSDTRQFERTGVELEPLVGSGNGNGDDPSGFDDVDRFGRGVSLATNLATEVIVFLHSVETYEVIARGENDTSLVGATIVRFFGPNDERIIVLATPVQGRYIVYGSTNTIAVSPTTGNTFTGQLLPTIKPTTLWSSHSPALANTDIVGVDGLTGDLWTGHDSGADTILVHWDLQMNEIERFTLTSIQLDTGDKSGLGYDAVSHSFFHVDGTTLWRFEIDTQTVTTLALPGNTNDNEAAFRSISNGIVYLQGGLFGGSVYQVDVANMVNLQTYDLSDWNAAAPEAGASRSPLYDPVLHAVIVSDTTNDPVNWIFLDRVSTDGVTLESILNNEVLRSGYEGGANDRDATDHASTIVLGWAAGNQTAVVGESDQQADLYKFGHVESDHKIKFPARWRATSFALTDDDLGVVPEGSEPSRKLQIERIDQSDLPVQSELQFSDPALDYQEGLQRAALVPETVPGTDKNTSRSFRVVLTNEEAKQREFQNLITKYQDQQVYRFTTFHNNMTIDPGDTGTLTADGTSHLVMVTETSLGANFIYECEAVGFAIPTLSEADAMLTELGTLNASLLANGPDGFIAQTIPQPNQTKFVMIDAPFMIDEVDPGNSRILNQMVAQRSSSSLSWDGAIIQKAPDGENYTDWHFYESTQEGEIGLVTSALGETRTWTVVDTVNTVNVSFRDDLVLTSVSDADFFAGKNNFMIGKEFIRARDVTDLGNGEWTLSHLLRGLRGTEYAVAERRWSTAGTFDHTKWEYAFYLGDVADSNKADAKSLPLTDLNLQYYYKAISIGGLVDTGEEKIFTNTGNSHRPYAPASIAGTKSGNDWSITWLRRNRIGGELHDFSDVPLTDPDIYEVDVMSEDGATVVRTITTTASAAGSVISGSTCTYKEADMQTDFENPVANGYPLYRLAVNVYQVNSETVGRGFPGAAVVEDFPDPLPNDANRSNMSLLLQLNDLSPLDKSPEANTINVDNGLSLVSGDWVGPDGAFGNPVSQYGDATVKFSGGTLCGMHIDRADMGTAFDFGSGDFTIEAWVDRTAELNNANFVAIWSSAGNREWRFAQGSSGPRLEFFYSTDGTNNDSILVNYPDADTTLAHIAVSRVGSTLSLYYRGTRLGTKDMTGVTIFSGGAADLTIGRDGLDTSNTRWSGRMDSIRIYKGVGLYSGATITRPPHAFSTT